jgi:isoquinoline 1-oxidoreductase beta subunit
LLGTLGPGAEIAAWKHRIVSTPIRAVFDSPEQLKDPKRVAAQELTGADNVPYFPANFRLEYVPIESGVPRAWWRSVADSFTAFAVECFVDELAHAARADPYEFRLKHVAVDRKLTNPRRPQDKPLDTRIFRQTLQLAAERSGWGRPLPRRHGRGIACHHSFDSYIAHVAEVSVDNDGNVRVHRVVSAVSCGTAVNPDGVRAMTEGGVNFGLTQALSGEITIRNGATEQSNFDGYQVLRMNYAPEIEVHILPGSGEPGGMGETAVPPIAPAVANAVFAATGRRIRRLPIDPAVLA